MIVTVASGKGGTGKTTITASLATVWEAPLITVDLDVEEPNLDLFLHPERNASHEIYLDVPEVDTTNCTYCGQCAELCQFKAISVLGQMVMTFPEMCHGCGGCMAICPEQVIRKGRRALGHLEIGATTSEIVTLTGRLRVGEAMSPPLMRVVRQHMCKMASAERRDVLIDAPPGVSCPAMSAVADSDVIVLVTEPTPFGFHDFQLAWEAFSSLGKPLAVFVNRAGLGDDRIYQFCQEHKLPIIGEIPYARHFAEQYSKGQIFAEIHEELHTLFQAAARQLRTLAGGHCHA